MRRLLPFTTAAAVVLATSLSAQWSRIATAEGDDQGDALGYSVAKLNDINGDNIPDLLIGAYSSDAGGKNSGAVFLYSGDDLKLNSTPLGSFAGQSAGNLLGWAVASLGDLDGDLSDEYAVSAPYFDGPAGLFAGRVYIVSGFSPAFLVDTLDGAAQAELFGSSLSAVDLDGDGTMELAVGAPGAGLGQTGAVYLYRWDGSGLVPYTTPMVSGAAPGDLYGWSVGSAGDIGGGNGEELLVGAPFATGGATESGMIDVLDNGTSTQTLTQNTANGHLGISVAGGRDINNDATPDLAGGAPDTANGDAWVWSGSDFSSLGQITGDAAGDQFGYSMAMQFDADFDDEDEIAIGAPKASGGQGSVEVFSINGTVDSLQEFTGSAGSLFGQSVAAIGDVNNDTKEDLLMGAPQHVGSNGPRQGWFEVWAPPDTNIDPPDITLSGSFTIGTDVDVDVVNLRPGATVVYYAGIQEVQTQTKEGYTIDIGPEKNLVRFAQKTATGAGTSTASLTIPAKAPAGLRVYFQVVEDLTSVRLSDVESGQIQSLPFTLNVENLPWAGGKEAWMTVENANPNQWCYFYFSVNGADATPQSQPQGTNWLVNLRNPMDWPPGHAFTTDGLGRASTNTSWQLPGQASGVTMWLQAFSWHSNKSKWKLSQVEQTTVQ